MFGANIWTLQLTGHVILDKLLNSLFLCLFIYKMEIMVVSAS